MVSVAEVMQSERKLRIKGLLKLHTKSGGDINVKTFLAKFSEVKKDKQDLNFISHFPFDDIDVTNSDELSALLMVTGYIAKKDGWLGWSVYHVNRNLAVRICLSIWKLVMIH